MTRHDMTWLLQWSKGIGRKFIEKKGTRNKHLNPHGAQKIKHGHVTIWAKSIAVTDRTMQDWSQSKEKIWAECTPYLQRMQTELNFTTLSLSLIGMYILILVITLIRKTLACSYSFNLFASALRHLYKFLTKNKLIAFNGLHLWPFLRTQVIRVS